MARLHNNAPALALVAGGALLRIQQYVARESLWTDEAMLAVNIARRGFLQLLQPLWYDQYAPPLFLWAERLAVIVGGLSERSLRAIPLLAGILSLWLTWRLASRLLPRSAALAALAVAAFCPGLDFYSIEAKPYSLDAAVATLLALLTIDVLRDSASGRGWWRLTIVGGVAVWLSTPAIFVLAGAGTALATLRGQLRRLGRVTLTWAVLFAIPYVLIYGRVSHSVYMQQFWAGAFLGFTSPSEANHSWRLLGRIVRPLLLGATPALGWNNSQTLVSVLTALVLTTVLLGALWLWRRVGLWASLLLGVSLLALLAASTIKAFPIAPRLVLFSVPFVVVLGTAGIAGVLERFVHPALRAPVLALATGLLVAAGIPRDGRWAMRRTQRTDVRSLIEEWRRSRRVGEPVYVNARGLPYWGFYTTDWTDPDTMRLGTLVRLSESGGQAFENAATRGHAVRDEGANLVLHGRWTELVGLPTGRQLRSARGLSQAEPDPGWAANEAARIVAAGGGKAWVMFFYSVDAAQIHLGRELLRRGARVVKSVATGDASVALYALPASVHAVRPRTPAAHGF